MCEEEEGRAAGWSMGILQMHVKWNEPLLAQRSPPRRMDYERYMAILLAACI
jgi:hypothetical protein